MALQGREFEIAVEGVDIGIHRQAQLLGALPVADHPVQHQLFVPLDIRVAQQRGDVVGDGAEDGVLEIEDAGIRDGAIVDVHQIARMVVAVHEYLLLRQDVRRDGFEYLVQLGLLHIRQGGAQVLADKPFGEQIHFAQDEGAVEFGQHVGGAGQLDFHQGFQRFGVQHAGVVVVQGVQIRGRAQVGQQQEALLQVLRDDVGHGHAGAFQQAGHLDKGGYVFALGRRIHGDQCTSWQVCTAWQYIEAVVAAEARIAGGGAGGIG